MSSYQVARALAELANIALAEGDAAEALEHVSQALATQPDHPDLPEWIGIINRCYEQGAFDRKLLDKAESIARKWKGDNRRLAELHSQLGEVYRRIGEAEKANDHLSKSIAFFRNPEGGAENSAEHPLEEGL